MATRIAINGVGRVGRLALRAAWGRPDLAVVHVNELNADAHTSAHLLTFDSVHGRWDRDVRGKGDASSIDSVTVGHSSHAQPGEVPWAEHGVDLVLECSGAFRTMDALAPYFELGVEKVVVAARSAAVQRAVQALRALELPAAYADAWERWEADGDAARWEPTAGDGV